MSLNVYVFKKDDNKIFAKGFTEITLFSLFENEFSYIGTYTKQFYKL